MPKIKRDILVVDDEQEIRDMLTDFLEEQDFNVTVAGDGLAAMAEIEKNLPGIVICDLLLPGEHGIDLVKSIKDKYFLPVIIITSIYQKNEVEDLMEEYFVEGFCEKPINLAELLRKIKSIIKHYEKKSNSHS
jgi:DNA-binding response OmpR family regulator